MNALFVLLLAAPPTRAAVRPANGAAFVRQTPPPLSMKAGEQATVTVTMKDTGRTGWTASAGYKLGAQSPQDGVVWRAGRVPLASGERITAGGTKTFAFTVVAPMAAGKYKFRWRMVRERVEWFGELTPEVEVTVTAPAPVDALDLSQVTILNSPDVRAWPAAARITELDLRAPDGIVVEFTKKQGPGAWPDVPDPSRWGADGGIQYTIWMVLNVGGRWYASGGMQCWTGRGRTGGAPSTFTHDWYYAPDRWRPMTDFPVRPGTKVGFFVTAGDARNSGKSLVQERSNVVLIDFPADSGGAFRF